MDRKGIAATVAALALAAGVALAVFFTTSGRTPDAGSLPDAAAAQLAKLKTVQGRLALGRDDQALEYELWVERPRHLRAEAELQGLDRKAVYIIMFNEDEAWTYDPLLDIATVTDRSKALSAEGARFGTSLLETMPEDLLAAMRAGDVQILGEETVAGREALRVQVLLPSAQNPLAQAGEQMTAWLDKRTYYPLAIEGDTGFRMRFSFIRYDEEIDPLTFVFYPPPGATVRRIGD